MERAHQRQIGDPFSLSTASEAQAASTIYLGRVS